MRLAGRLTANDQRLPERGAVAVPNCTPERRVLLYMLVNLCQYEFFDCRANRHFHAWSEHAGWLNANDWTPPNRNQVEGFARWSLAIWCMVFHRAIR
jgi:hypothetical protein